MSTDTETEIRHTRALWLLSFALWTVAWFLNAGSEIIDVVTGDLSASVWEPVVWEFTSNYAWAVLTPFIVIFALRHRLSRSNWAKMLPLYLLAMVLFSIAHVAGMVSARKLIYWAIGDSYEFWQSIAHLGLEMIYELLKDIFTFWMLTGFAYGFDYYRRYKERELKTAQLEAQLAHARLDNLIQQLHPHFIFNTLNTISAIMHENVRAADTIITRLSDLLRLAFEKSDRQEVPLQDEVEALEIYLDIMRARYQDRLAVDMSIDPEARDALVPVLILQPLVENAIKHGVDPRPDGGRVSVSAQRKDGTIRLEVSDDGPGAEETADQLLRKGFGLSSTVERLQQLYGQAQTATLHNGPAGGFSVTLDFPYRPAAQEPQSAG